MMLDIDNISLGTYRARAMVHYGRINSACQSGIQGEVEDFLIEIIEPQSCSAVIEDFIYDVEEELEGLDGGARWSSAWAVDMEDENSQISITEGSLIADAGNKIGILNAGPTNITISRSIDQGLLGSSELYFRINLFRASGSGSVDVYFNDMKFGINESGKVYLGDTTAQEIELNETISFLGKIIINREDVEQVYLWTNYTSFSPNVEDAIQYQLELGNTLNDMKISLTSTDSFVPLVHFVDGIKIGCDENFRNNKSGLAVDSRIRAPQSLTKKGSLELSVYPNPSFIEKIVIEVVGEQAVHPYTLHDANGKLMKSGHLLGGLNRLPRQGMKAGIYYLTIKDEGVVHREKIIIVT